MSPNISNWRTRCEWRFTAASFFSSLPSWRHQRPHKTALIFVGILLVSQMGQSAPQRLTIEQDATQLKVSDDRGQALNIPVRRHGESERNDESVRREVRQRFSRCMG
jgi:hypothetical protein